MPPAVWPLVERLLTRYLPARCLASTLGDLIEDYQRRLDTQGRLRAELWLARESLSLTTAYRTARRHLRLSRRTSMDMLRSDVIHAWRAMRARPTATLATVAVLTLGIGLVSAMFALADPYLLRPLPFAKPHELYQLNLNTWSQAHVPALADLTARTDLFAGVLSQAAETVTVEGNGNEVTLRLAAVTPNYFDVLGVPMAIPAEWRHLGNSTETPVILTASTASRVFGRAQVEGQSLRRTDGPGGFRVATTLAAPFVDPFARPGTTVDGFIPFDDRPLLSIQTSASGNSGSAASVPVLVRLQPGVTAAIVSDMLSTTRAENPMPRDGVVIVADSLVTRLTERVRPMAFGALAAGLLILVVCSANVANLLLVRGATRTREFASREALGASRADIARLVLVELGLLTVLGVAGGLAVAKGALLAAALVIPAEYTTLGAPAITARVVGLACLAGVLVMLAGMVPGWAAWRVSPLALFNRIASGETIRVRVLRFTMTVAQTALAVVLLVGAVLFGRSYVNLIAQDPGYDGDTFAITVSYGQGVQVNASMMADALERLRSLPGVTHAGVSRGSLVDGSVSGGVGGNLTINGQRASGLPQQVSLGFLETLGARIVDGRLWTMDDHGRTAIVNESFATDCCDGRPIVGQVLGVGERSFEIVGVVQDLYTTSLDRKPGPTVFLPLETGSGTSAGWPRVNYVIRTAAPNAGLALAAERALKAADAGIIVSRGASMRERLMQSINDRSFATLIVVFFGLAAIGVSAAGVVGVVGFVVARRTREIAIRLAIGATAGDVRGLVTREAGIAAAVGAVSGLVVARWLSKTVESLLYGIEPADPFSFVLAAGAIVAIVVGAAWVPARRASQISPTIALRAE